LKEASYSTAYELTGRCLALLFEAAGGFTLGQKMDDQAGMHVTALGVNEFPPAVVVFRTPSTRRLLSPSRPQYSLFRPL